jgi:glycosyltransferase involved in cell wall biosynthesis
MKLAIVHDFLLSYGGAERVIEQVHEIYPTAPIYTLRYNAEKMHHKMDGWDIRSSFVDNIPVVKDKGHTLAMSLYPLAIESFDFKEFDIVLSFSSTFAHGIITQPKTTHICYYHTPARFLWDYHFSYLKEKGWDKGLKAPYAKKFLHKLRIWDYLAAQRPDVCFANSNTIKDRVSKFYRRESDTIYPGVEIDNYKATKEHQNYYVTVCRLTKPKRVELAVEACTKLKLPLHVIGTGEELDNLKAIAGPTITFCGFLNDQEVADKLASAKALLWPNIDDFGLVPIEAMASGTPVVAYNKGGATETVVHGKTGVLFDNQTVDGLIKGIQELDNILPSPDAKAIRAHAEQFSKIAFQKNIKAIIDKEYQKLSTKSTK